MWKIWKISEKLLEKSSDCTKEILEAKNSYILKIIKALRSKDCCKNVLVCFK